MLISRTRARCRRVVLTMVAMAACIGASSAAPAQAGMYDYTLTVLSGYYDSRGVVHDYRYLRSYVYAASTCVKRGGGQPFCGGPTADHHYSDSCGSCYSFYFNGDTVTRGLDIHDEWV